MHSPLNRREIIPGAGGLTSFMGPVRSLILDKNVPLLCQSSIITNSILNLILIPMDKCAYLSSNKPVYGKLVSSQKPITELGSGGAGF